MWSMKPVLMNADADHEAGDAAEQNPPQTENRPTEHREKDALLSRAEPHDRGDWLPEKYRVMGDNGTLQLESSARQLAEAYTQLEKRRGEASVLPATPEDYAPELDVEGVNWAEYKQDPQMQRFLKSAHTHGISNDQMGFILGEYLQRAPALVSAANALDADTAASTLREVWRDDAEFQKNLGLAYRAFTALADDGDQAHINEIGNNPLAIRLLAKIGTEMQEDRPAGVNVGLPTAETVQALLHSAAYRDNKHPEHVKVTRQVSAYYARTFGNTPVA